MTCFVRYIRSVGIGFSVLMICHALAQNCTSTADCGGTGICSGAFLFFPGHCVSFASVIGVCAKPLREVVHLPLGAELRLAEKERPVAE
jgi:hypothetical protein